ncbi:tyrosine-type recombinase/integrase [Microbacterium sp. SZ1]|uniref:tyrosine-type recombinase/integrase n=1 Tax=Microbacterium sp. SZ1 TaxID=1849736 RepID=UPI00117E0524|nr:integrase [Microbacterium sp. SZ1]
MSAEENDASPEHEKHTLVLGEVSRKRVIDLRINDALLRASDITGTLDGLQIPDGTPFLAEANGEVELLRFVNAYLLDAAQQRAYPLGTLRTQHAAVFRRLLERVRDKRDPCADLIDVTREDLFEYRDHRRSRLQSSSWNSELSIISNFFRYAREKEWIARDPVARWGSTGRVTMKAKEQHVKRIRFLTEGQARFFLEAGLRGDGAAPEARVTFPERDYAFGLTLVSTGLRRLEASLLLEAEIPKSVDASGVHVFWRVGKGDRPREIWVAEAVATAIDHYRLIEREYVVQRAQRALRKAKRDGRLVMAEVLERHGEPRFRIDGVMMRAEQIGDDLRRHAVRVRPDGMLDPLALFVMQGGRGPSLKRFNATFNEASERVALFGPHRDSPPAHLSVTPHIMRHTFAVRMLAALMRHGRETAGNPNLHLTHPLLVVQELLGHARRDTTELYLHHAHRYSDQVPNVIRDAAVRMVSTNA